MNIHFSKKGKRRLIFLGVVLVLIVVGMKITSRMIDDYLVETVNRGTKGLYQITYDDLTVGFFTRKITLENFTLTVDSTKANAIASSEQPTFYKIVVPEFHIGLRNLYSFYFTRKLSVRQIYIDDPHFYILNLFDTNRESRLTSESGDLYYLISDILEELGIDRLDVNHCAVDFRKLREDGVTVFDVQDLSFNFDNFELSSRSSKNKTKILYTDNIQLTVLNQEYYLPDSVHVLRFDSLNISTLDSIVLFSNLQLKQRPEVQVALHGDKNIYNIDIPEFSLRGLDFQKAYNENKIVVRSINLNEANLDIVSRIIKVDKSDADSSKIESNSIPKLVSTLFSAVSIDTISIVNGNLNYALSSDKNFSFTELNLGIFDLSFDSTITRIEHLPDFRAYKLSVNDQKMFLMDSLIQIGIEELVIDSEDSTFVANKMHVLTDPILGTDEVLSSLGLFANFNTSLDRLEMKGVRFSRLIDDQIFEAREINIVHPTLESDMHESIIDLVEENRRSKSDSASTAKTLMSSFIKDVIVEDIAIKKGNILITEKDETSLVYSVADLSFRLNKFQLSKKNVSKHDIIFSENASLHCGRSHLNLRYLGYVAQWDEIDLSTLRKNILLSNVHIKNYNPQRGDDIVNIDIPRLHFTGMNLVDVYKRNIFDFDTLRIQKANVYYDKYSSPNENAEKSSKPLSDKIEKLILDHLAIEDVSLDFRKKGKEVLFIDSTNIHIDGFALDENELKKDRVTMKFDQYHVGSGQWIVDFPNQPFAATLTSFDMNSINTNGYFNDIHFYSTPKDSLKEDIFNINIPQIYFEGYDPVPGDFSRNWDLGNFKIVNPTIDIKIGPRPTEASIVDTSSASIFAKILQAVKPLENTKGKLEAMSIDTLQASTLNITNAEVRYRDAHLNDVATTLNLSVDRLFIDPYTQFSDDKFLSTDRLIFQLNKTSVSSPSVNANIDELSFDSKPGTFSISNLTSAESNAIDFETHGKFDLSKAALDVMEIKGINLNRILTQERIDLDLIAFKGGNISAYFPIKKQKNTTDTLQTKSKRKLPIINVKEIDVETHNLCLVQEHLVQDIPLTIDRVAVKVKNLNSEKFDEPKNVFADAEIDIVGIETLLDSGLYMLNIGNIHSSTTEASLSINEFTFKPTVDPTEIARIKQDQIPVTDAFVEQIAFTDVDYGRLLSKQEFFSNHININRVILNLFKDKRIPPKVHKEKPLPASMLQLIPMPIHIDSLSVSNMFISHTEFSKNGLRPGTVEVSDMRSNIYHITNHMDSIAKDSLMHAYTYCKVMHQGELEADIYFNLASEKDEFSYTGRMGPMDLSTLNGFSEPVFFITIDQGTMESMHFSATGNNDVCIGEMGFYYNDFSMQTLRQRDESRTGVGNVLASLVGNAMVKTNNPDWIFNREKNIYFERDKGKALPNYLIKICISGMISNIKSIKIGTNQRKIKKVEKEWDLSKD